MIFIPFIWFTSLLAIHLVRMKTVDIGGILLSLYSLSSLMSVFLYNTDFLPYGNQHIGLNACLYYCGILTLFIHPFLSRKQSTVDSIINPPVSLLMAVSWSLIIINISAMILSSKWILFILTHDPGSLKSVGSLTQELAYSPNAIESFGKTLFGYFSGFYMVILVIFFYSLSYGNTSNIFKGLLLLSSTSTILHGISAGSRTELIYWLLTCVACYVYFRKHIPQPKAQTLNKILLLVILMLLVYFTTVSKSRFSDSNSTQTDHPVLYSIADYSGMSFLRFNDFFLNFKDDNFTLARIFPLAYDLISASKFDLAEYRQSLSMDIGIFYTFLGDLFVDIGIKGTIVYLLCFRILFALTQKPDLKRSKGFHQVLIFFLLLQIPWHGLFYYSLWNKTATIGVTGTVMLAILLRILARDPQRPFFAIFKQRDGSETSMFSINK